MVAASRRPAIRVLLAVIFAFPALGLRVTEGAAIESRVIQVAYTVEIAPGVGRVEAFCPGGAIQPPLQLVSTGISFGDHPEAFRLLSTEFLTSERVVLALFSILNSDSVPHKVVATVICLKAFEGVSEAHWPGDHDVTPGEVELRAARCPSGTFRIGGGGGVFPGNPLDDPPYPYVLTNDLTSGTWRIVVDNRFPNARPAIMRTLATCATADVLGTLRPEDQFASNVTAQANSRAEQFVPCPSGAEVVAGGFSIPPVSDLFLESSQPSVVNEVEGWTVSVVNPTAQSQVFSAVAICLVES